RSFRSEDCLASRQKSEPDWHYTRDAYVPRRRQTRENRHTFEAANQHFSGAALAKPFRIGMIAGTMPSLLEQIDRALSDGKLRADAAENIRRILSSTESDFAARVIVELSQANEWEELNARVYKTLAFGT